MRARETLTLIEKLCTLFNKVCAKWLQEQANKWQKEYLLLILLFSWKKVVQRNIKFMRKGRSWVRVYLWLLTLSATLPTDSNEFLAWLFPKALQGVVQSNRKFVQKGRSSVIVLFVHPRLLSLWATLSMDFNELFWHDFSQELYEVY